VSRRALALAAWALAAPAASSPRDHAQAPPPTFGVRVARVYVDAFVTRGGRPLRGLAAADFELKDEGVVQEVELVGADTLPLLAVLVFDTSSSVAGPKLVSLRSAAEAFLDGLRPSDEAGLLAFSHEIEWLAPPSADRNRIRRALDGMKARGATAALDALYAGLVLPATPARSLVVMFSDGEDNMSWLDDRQVRTVAERSNALVHVVALAPRDAPAEEAEHLRGLRRIAEATGGRLWTAASPERLQGAFADVARAMNERYILRYEPRNLKKRAGWHRIEVRLRRESAEVRARRGYWIGESRE
jgi:VWFA-related protein